MAFRSCDWVRAGGRGTCSGPPGTTSSVVGSDDMFGMMEGPALWSNGSRRGRRWSWPGSSFEMAVRSGDWVRADGRGSLLRASWDDSDDEMSGLADPRSHSRVAIACRVDGLGRVEAAPSGRSAGDGDGDARGMRDRGIAIRRASIAANTSVVRAETASVAGPAGGELGGCWLPLASERCEGPLPGSGSSAGERASGRLSDRRWSSLRSERLPSGVAFHEGQAAGDVRPLRADARRLVRTEVGNKMVVEAAHESAGTSFSMLVEQPGLVHDVVRVEVAANVAEMRPVVAWHSRHACERGKPVDAPGTLCCHCYPESLSFVRNHSRRVMYDQ